VLISLLGCCYVLVKVLRVVAMALLCICEGVLGVFYCVDTVLWMIASALLCA